MSEQALDFDEFMARVQNDKDLFFELLDIFVEDYKIKRKEFDEAMAEGNPEKVEHIAHFLKGSCGNISAKMLREIFIRLEEKGARGSLEGVEQDLKEVDQLYEELTACIKELRGRL